MINELIKRYPALADIKEEILCAVDVLEATYKCGGKVLVCGNGGSAADSEHIVGELMKSFIKARPLTAEQTAKYEGLTEDPKAFAKSLQNAIPAISLPSQSGIISAFANDVDASMVYAQLVHGYGNEGDLLIGLSTSGNSRNVVNAVIAARAKGVKTLALTGAKDSRLSALCDITLKAPETETFKVQELHLPIYHFLCAELENRLF